MQKKYQSLFCAQSHKNDQIKRSTIIGISLGNDENQEGYGSDLMMSKNQRQTSLIGTLRFDVSKRQSE